MVELWASQFGPYQVGLRSHDHPQTIHLLPERWNYSSLSGLGSQVSQLEIQLMTDWLTYWTPCDLAKLLQAHAPVPPMFFEWSRSIPSL